MTIRKLTIAVLLAGLLGACSPDDNPGGNPGYTGDADNTATTSGGVYN